MPPFHDDFSYSFLKKIINRCNELGSVVSLRQYDHSHSHETKFIWRHDIDIDLDRMLEMAKVESLLGISATYMVIPESPLYQISGDKGQSILRQISRMGHEIALHFDIDSARINNPADTNEVNRAIDQDLKKVEQACGEKVSSISFHRPINEFIRGPRYINGCLNAYAKELMEFYISDSGGNWREGHPLRSLDRFDHSVGQILTHPIWWAVEHRSPAQNLEILLRKRSLVLSLSELVDYKKDLKRTIPRVKLHKTRFLEQEQ